MAHDWLTRIYEPVTRTVPRSLAAKLEPAEIFHEVLEHRWFLSERDHRDYAIEEAVADYLTSILPSKPDEAAVVGIDTIELPVVARDL